MINMYFSEYRITLLGIIMTEKGISNIFDTLDYKIIQQLHGDGRATATSIASRTGADVRTIRNRIARLIGLGAIRVTAIADPTSFGYQTAADIFLQVDPKKESELIQRFLSMTEVSYVAYGSGSGEISLEVRFKNNAELREFLVHTLSGIPGVISIRHTLVPEILKNIDEWMPSEGDFNIEGPAQVPTPLLEKIIRKSTLK
jgi:DNA-binding Lrp family transcriptional regulator